MRRFVMAMALVLLVQSTAQVTWSVIALDTRTGQVIIAEPDVRQANQEPRRTEPRNSAKALARSGPGGLSGSRTE
jgi:hypothetical protein